MPTFIKNKSTAIVKLEATSGTYSAPVATDFDCQLFEPTWDPEVDYWINHFASGRHSYGQGVPGKRKLTFSAKMALRTSSALGTAPKVGKLFKAAGQTETIVAATSVAYTPDATKDEGNNVTASVNMILVPTSGNALIVAGKGCLANCILTMDALGQPFIAEFQFVGAFYGIADGSVLALTSPDTTIPSGTLGSALTIAGNNMQIGKSSLDFGNKVELDEDGGDAAGTGYAAAYFSDRAPKWTMDPKQKLLAVDPHYTRWIAGTEVALSHATASVGGQRIICAAPKAQLKTNKRADRNGAETNQQEYELHENVGNDAHSVSFAA